MNYKNEWLFGCFGNLDIEEVTRIVERIQVRFKDGRKVNYTSRIIDNLKRDKTVLEIMSLETGEIYFVRDNAGNVVYNA